MNCTQAQEWLGPLLDGELAGSEARDLREHLAGCPACEKEQASFDELAAVTDVAFATPQVDELAWERVWRGVAQETQSAAGARRKSALLWAAAAAVVVVAVLATTWSLRNGSEGVPDRLALLQGGGARMEMVQGGNADYFPVVTMTDAGDPVIFVYEAGE